MFWTGIIGHEIVGHWRIADVIEMCYSHTEDTLKPKRLTSFKKTSTYKKCVI